MWAWLCVCVLVCAYVQGDVSHIRSWFRHIKRKNPGKALSLQLSLYNLRCHYLTCLSLSMAHWWYVWLCLCMCLSPVCIDQVEPYISSGLYRCFEAGRPIDEAPCFSEPRLASGHGSTLHRLRLTMREIRARPIYRSKIESQSSELLSPGPEVRKPLQCNSILQQYEMGFIPFVIKYFL